ncbi:hypothetical protein GCM10007856_40400 [Azospirillum oryzae]|nr:hypothetical protein GCM10007856_40400 [Azospirillum oryzae]
MVTECFVPATEVVRVQAPEALPVTDVGNGTGAAGVTGNGFRGTEMAYFHGAGIAFALSSRPPIR